MLALGLDDKLPHFRVDLARLPAAVDLVIDVTRKNYPSLDVPFHSRWRHFVCNGEDRWAALDRNTTWRDAAVRGRAAFDLAIVSVASSTPALDRNGIIAMRRAAKTSAVPKGLRSQA